MRKRRIAAAITALSEIALAAATPPATPGVIVSTDAVVPPPPPAALVSIVHRWILDGQAEHDIREAITLKIPEWTGPADALIGAAVERFADAGKFQSEIMLGWCAEAYRDLYRVAWEAGNLPAALRAVKLLSELAGF